MIVLQILIAISFSVLLIILTLSTVNVWGKQKLLQKYSLGLTILTVAMVETMVRLEGGLQNISFFKLHLPFSITYTLSLIILLVPFRWKTPAFERVLSYICLGAYIGAFITGMTLLMLF